MQSLLEGKFAGRTSKLPPFWLRNASGTYDWEAMFIELGSNITSKAIPAEQMLARFYTCHIFL